MIIVGDCREKLRELTEKSVNTCVTSPPYFGLRTYHVDGQMGLENSPEEFVSALVGVFREVRRVLRDDGTIFLNLGDSYWNNGTKKTGRKNTNRATEGGRDVSFRGDVRRAASCGTSGKAPASYPIRDCLCESLCGVCRKAYQIGKSHSGSQHAPMPVPLSFESTHGHKELSSGHSPTLGLLHPAGRSGDAKSDLGSLQSPEFGLPPASLLTMTDGSSQRLLEDCRPLVQTSFCLLCEKTLVSDDRPSACKTVCLCGSRTPFLSRSGLRANIGGISETGDSLGENITGRVCDLAYPDYTTSSRHAQLKSKDLIGIPWRVAFALQSDGWYLRQDIIWCLSGGTVVYARTQNGDSPSTIKDLARLDPSTVKLWNGKKWTQVLGWSCTARNADELEIVLRSGERISCTPNHQFPTSRGLLRADEIVVGDSLVRVRLPEPNMPKSPSHIGEDAAWLAGLYLAEGSMSEDTIQLAGHASETDRLVRVRKIAESYGGTATCTLDGNNQKIRVYGKVIVAIIAELVSGKTAKNKCVAPVCWRYGDSFLRSFLYGYLSGDGHWDESNGRWILGFARNYNLERDLRVMAARLGFNLTLRPVMADGFGKTWPAFRGEIRFDRSGHHNEKNTAEVMEIRKSRCRQVYDVGVEDDPHLFALASGILTHNSKPNPMPESVRDRCTKAHEYIFLLSKSEKYYFDAESIKERATYAGRMRGGSKNRYEQNNAGMDCKVYDTRNKRSVWTVNTKPFKGAHFATFPEELITPCVTAGCPEDGLVLDPFAGAGTTWVVCKRTKRKFVGIELNPEYAKIATERAAKVFYSESLFK